MLRIYGYKGCHYCELAQELLNAKGIPFDYYDIKTPEQKDKLAELQERGLKTVPQVFKNDVHVGGYNDLYSAVMLGSISK